jgi:hypothetical protein
VTSTAHEAVTLERTSSTEAVTNSTPTQQRDGEGDLHCGGGRDQLMFSVNFVAPLLRALGQKKKRQQMFRARIIHRIGVYLFLGGFNGYKNKEVSRGVAEDGSFSYIDFDLGIVSEELLKMLLCAEGLYNRGAL